MKKPFCFVALALISILSVPTVLAQYYPFAMNPPQNVPVYIIPNNMISYVGSQPVFLYSELMKEFSRIPSVCYTSATLPLYHKTYRAGEQIAITGSVNTPTIGYGVVDPKVNVYFDGTYIGTAYGDMHGNYHFAFTVPPYLYSGYHSLSINATLAGCEPSYVHERIYIEEYDHTVPPYYYTTSNMGDLVFNVKDCDTGQYISAYAVLSPGLYSKSSTTGTILFSAITVRDYDFYVSSGGYLYESGSVGLIADSTVTREVCLRKIHPPAPSPPQTIVVPPEVDPPVPEFHLQGSGTTDKPQTFFYSISPIVILLPLAGIAFKIREKHKKFRTPEEI